MPQYYLFANGGERTGTASLTNLDGGTDFSTMDKSLYYNSLFDITINIPNGGVFLVSHRHVETNETSGSIYLRPQANTGSGITSVNHFDVTKQRNGATINMPNANMRPLGTLTLTGMNLNIADGFYTSTAGYGFRFDRCKIRITGATGNFTNGSVDYAAFEFIDTDVYCEKGTSIYSTIFNSGTNCNIRAINSKFHGSDNLLVTSYGINVNFTNCDFTEIPGSIVNSVDVGTTPILHNADMIFEGCKLGPTTVAIGSALSSYPFRNAEIRFTNCERDGATVENVFEFKGGGGITCVFDTATYRTNSPALPTEAKYSFKTNIHDEVEVYFPAQMDLCEVYADLTSVSSDTFTIYFASDDTLREGDIWFELVYRTVADNMLFAKVDNRPASILYIDSATRPALTIDATQAWTGTGATNKYSATLTTTGVAGIAGYVQVKVFHANPGSNSVFVDPQVVLS